MAVLLGIDTGGTFTDAVLYDEEEGVLAKAKSLTTHHDLAIGVGGAVGAVLAQSDVAPARIDTAGRDDAGRDRSSLVGFNDEPIRSRLKGAVGEWAPGTVFELENGQQWKVLKGRMTLKTPLDAPQIEVIPGVAGRWFLQVHEDYPKARVYRID